MIKSFNNYQKNYIELPFEFHQASLRRLEILKVLKKYKPDNWLEVGCGMNPLFIDYPYGKLITVVEPADKFFKKLTQLKNDFTQLNTQLINSRLEDLINDSNAIQLQDLIIISSLLHEIPNTKLFLKKVFKLGDSNTKYIFIVPNANSMHRQIAHKMGIIDELNQLSKQQILLEQNIVYSPISLKKELENNDFKVETIETIILKPFTHFQMQNILDHNILTKEHIYTLSQMVNIAPDFGSEILAIASKRAKN